MECDSLQLFYQVLNFAMIVSSALMIWKGLMVVSGSESPIVVVLRYCTVSDGIDILKLQSNVFNVFLHFFPVGNLDKGKKKERPSGLELLNSKTNRSAYDNPSNCAKWQFVANYIISLPFMAQHVIGKKLVLSLTRLSFPLVRCRHNRVCNPVLARQRSADSTRAGIIINK